MSQPLESQVHCASQKARNLLGQLGPLVWALHEAHASVVSRAILLSVDPQTYVRIAVCDPGDARRNGVVADLESLRRGVSFEEAPRLFKSDGLRDTVNRSVIVYAVAVLEQFLDGAGREVYKREGEDESKWPDSFGKRVGCLRCVGIGLQKCEHYPQAALLALYRHKIVHVDAQVDEKLVCQLAGLDEGTGRQFQFRLSDDESSVVWVRSGGEKLSSLWAGKRLSLAVDEVVLPLLQGAQAFVGEAECAISTHVRRTEVSHDRTQGGLDE